MNPPEYSVFRPEKSPFSRPVQVRLLASSTANLDITQLSDEQWRVLNSATTIAGEAALTCYSPHLYTPLDLLARGPKHRALHARVVKNTRESGHHSTREHKTYIFAIQNITRKTIHDLLHSQRHHATDQESQRYVEMSEEGVVLPLSGNEQIDRLVASAANELFAGYHSLSELLFPTTRELYLARFPGKRSEKWSKKADDAAVKLAQETARYLLPLSMGANLYHSINELTLIRLAKLTQANEDKDPEAYHLVRAMIAAVAMVDPTILEEIGEPFDISTTPDYEYYLNNETDPYAAADEFDAALAGQPGRFDPQLDLDARLARAVRLTLNVSQRNLSDEEAIDLVLNPAKNPILASVDGLMVVHQLSQALNQVGLSARISISHVINSQLQRHRGFDHTRPLIMPIPRLKQDIVVPLLILKNPRALELFLRLQANNIRHMEELMALGLDEKFLPYLHTNASRIRKLIHGPLGPFHHFLRLRTCLNAQTENYDLAVTLTRQLPQISPLIATHFDKPAPCGIRVRANARPYCPEGDHYCGIPIWKRTIDDYPVRDI